MARLSCEPRTIVLAAGAGGGGGQQFGRQLPDAMVPVNGKPALGLILDDLLRKGIESASVVHRAEDRALERFVRRAYAPRMDIRLVGLDASPSILHSLKAGLEAWPGGSLLRVVLGDTLIEDRFDREGDYVYAGLVEDSRRWCVVTVGPDGVALDYTDKGGPVPGPRTALAGYYQFQDLPRLRADLDATLASGARELSALLRRYASHSPIHVYTVEQWLDFGHVDKLVDARRTLLRPRNFNTLTVDPVLNTIRKVSTRTEKLQDEIDWYLCLPAELQVLTPRLLTRSAEAGHVEIEQEYYGYPTLGELFVYAELDSETWGSILRHVLRIHDLLRRYSGDLSAEDVRSMYVDKTRQRLAAIEQDGEWRALLALDTLEWNGRRLAGWPRLEPTVWRCAEQLVESVQPGIVHGDLCFSNILFDLSARIARLIDPRGRFGRKGLYGDPRYDLAKLRHSASGCYDYIVADMFELRGEAPAFESEIFLHEETERVGALFDEMLRAAGHDLEQVKLIEGLLFLSMLPLHRGEPVRQRMMFLTGLALLNEVCA